jgi:hypothetical protein
MARLDFEDFLDKEVTRLYLAARLSEAKRVETTLTANGIDYAVDIEPFFMVVLGIMPSVYAGAAFYVLSAQTPIARSTLLAAGLKAGIEAYETSGGDHESA